MSAPPWGWQLPEWDSIDDVWDVAEEPFTGGFDRVCRDQKAPSYLKLYKPLVDNALAGGTPNPRLENSESSHTDNQSGAKFEIYGNKNAGAAHSVPHSPICSPLWGIDTQAFVGFDIERHIGNTPGKRELLVKTLQQVVCGRVGDSRRGTGFRYAPSNLLWLPKPHVDIYDDDPLLMVVPILTLEEVKNWDPANPSYWVLVLAGTYPGQPDPDLTNEMLYGSRVIMLSKAQQGEREKCTRGDIKKVSSCS